MRTFASGKTLLATIVLGALLGGVMQPTRVFAIEEPADLTPVVVVPGEFAGARHVGSADAATEISVTPVVPFAALDSELVVDVPEATHVTADQVVTLETEGAGILVDGAARDVGGLGLRISPAASIGEDAALRSADPAEQVSARFLDPSEAQKAGLSPVAVELARTDGGAGKAPVGLRIPSAMLDGAFGADYASRVTWVQLDSEGVPSKNEIEDATEVASMLDGDDIVLSPMVGAGPTMLMALAAPVASNGAGTFTATSLKPSDAWDVSTQTGTFSWSYPFVAPPSPAGQTPQFGLSYNSQAVDGLTAATNNQSSSIGEGWSLSGSGFIERTYVACAADDGPTGKVPSSGDLCWKTDNATVSFAGHSGQLVKKSDGTWRLQSDDNTRFERIEGGVCQANGTYDSTCWKMTTTDGTQYFFGLNQLPGYSAGKTATDSMWTVPVFGNDPGEPGYTGTFASSWKQQGWRWNLDYIVDPNGNAQALYYNKQTNRYALNGKTGVAYDRGGELSHVEYGLTSSSVYAANAASGRIEFGYDGNGRCTPGASCTAQPVSGNATVPSIPSAYPDVPFDQLCTSGDCTSSQVSPTFWTTSRLASVTTKVLKSGAYSPVDTWQLTHSFPDPVDNAASLWLRDITHTGKNGASLAEPSVIFYGTAMANRVLAVDGQTWLHKFRLTGISTELGATTSINYRKPDCAGSEAPGLIANAASSNRLCFPQTWVPSVTPPQPAETSLFNKYVVESVIDNPNTGNRDSAALETRYTYGSPAWRYNPSPLVPSDKRTWNVFAGFQTVTVRTGAVDASAKVTEYTYFQGVDGDRTQSGGAKSASVLGMKDSLWFSGRVRQVKEFDGAAVIRTTLMSPWASAATASDGTYTSLFTGDGEIVVTEPVSTGGNRTVTTRSTFSSATGLVERVSVERSDTLDQCTITSYAAANTSAWIVGLPAVTKTLDQSCSASTPEAEHLLGESRIAYDGGTVGAAPSMGLVTKTETVTGIDGATTTTAVTSSMSYDSRGRVTSVKDAAGRETKSAFTPSGSVAGPVTKIVTTNPKGWEVVQMFDPARGSVLSETDVNGNLTEATYDALGRITGVWSPAWPKASNPTPSTQYTYSVSKTAESTVKTVVEGSLTVAFELLDGLGRTVQTQRSAAGLSGGMVVTDVSYDAQGRVSYTNNPYSAAAEPTGNLFVPVNQQQIPSKVENTYDSAGRLVKAATVSMGVEKSATTSAYPGADRVDVTPPTGGTPTTAFSDSRGSKTKLIEYDGSVATGRQFATTYSYDARQQLTRMVDGAGNEWTWGYDLQGRKVIQKDPDSGVTGFTYDAVGNQLTSTDARGITLAYSYDELNRKTELRSTDSRDADDSFFGWVAGLFSDPSTKRSVWTYDSADGGKGRLASSSSFVDGREYKSTVTGYDELGNDLGATLSIPSGAPAFGGTEYTVSKGYFEDGQLAFVNYPAFGGLPTERLRYTYDGHDHVATIGSTQKSPYALAEYNALGQRTSVQRNGTKAFVTSFGYDAATGAVTNIQDMALRDGVPADRVYARDAAGNVTSITTSSGATGQPFGPTDVQCFSYDGLRNLTEAWTSTAAGCAAPAAATVGGVAPYWKNYTFDLATGNRLSETVNPVGSSGSVVTSTYAYPSAGAAQPHAVGSVTSSGSAGSFSYDAAGNMLARPGQTLTWDEQGRLSSVKSGSVTQSRIYDADGVLLMLSDSKEGATLFVGANEFTIASGGSAAGGVRTYTMDGTPVAQRVSKAGVSGTSLLWLGGDANGTQDVQMDDKSGELVRRYLDPYGVARGVVAVWGSAHGYLNKSVSATVGLTHVGAREYDPVLGRFVSVDPVLAPGNPRQSNGYGYAANNPVTFTDPDGRCYVAGSDSLSFTSNCGGGNGIAAPQTPVPVGQPKKSYGPTWNAPQRAAAMNAAAVKRYQVWQFNLYAEIISAKAALASAGIAASVTPNEAMALSELAEGLDYIDENVLDPLTTSPLVLAGAGGKVGAKGATKGIRGLLEVVGKTAGGTPKLTSPMQKALAKERGWTWVKGRTSHDQPVFKVGKKYVSWDTEGHRGGVWKMANTVKDLDSKNTRLGTYNDSLTKRIGD